ncbi:MAG: glycosyltransferase family 87 protein [Terriglobales bacterium]
MQGEQQGNRATVAGVITFSFLPVLLVAFLYPDARRGHTDFLSFYTGARLVGTEDLYSIERAGEIQAPYGAPDQIVGYTRPPFFAVFVYPLGLLPYSVGHTIWQFLNVAALAGFIALWPRNRIFAAILSCWFVPILGNFSGGQDAPILLFLVAATLNLLRSGRPFLAGAVLALCAFKFHLFVLTPVWIIATRRWRVAYGMLCAGAVLAAISFGAAGPNWIPVNWAATRRYDAALDYTAKMPNLLGLLHAMPHADVLVSIGALGVAILTWLVARKEDADFAFALTLAGGVLVGMHGFLYDCSLLLPLLLALAERFGNTFALRLSAVLSLLTITLTIPAVSYVGQLSVIALFGYAVYAALTSRTAATRVARAA